MTKNLRNKLVSQAILAASQLVFPLITYPIVTKALRAGGLGKINFADAIVQTVLIIASLGIPLYGIREVAIQKETHEKARVFHELFILQLLFVMPAIACVWIIGIYSKVDSVLLWTGTVALVSSCLSCEWWFQGNASFFYIAIRTLIVRSLAALMIYLFVTDEGDDVFYYAVLAGSVAVTMVMNLILMIPISRVIARPIKPFRHLAAINWLYGCYVLASLYTVMDSLFLGWMTTAEFVGYYSFGYRLVRMCSMLIPTLGIVFIPVIAFYYAAANKEAVQSHVNHSQQLIFFLGIPMSLSFLVLAPEIVSVFGNEHFRPSVNVLRILSPIPLLVSFSHLTGTQLLVSMRKEKIYLIFLAAGGFINILLNVALIPGLHEQGAAVSNLGAEALVAIGTFFYLKKAGVLLLDIKKILSYLLPALMMLPIAYLFRFMGCLPWITLVLSVLATGTIYLTIHFHMVTSDWVKKLFFLEATEE